MYRGIMAIIAAYLLFILGGLYATRTYGSDFELKDRSDSLWLTTIVTKDAVWIKIKPTLKPFGELLKHDQPKETRLCSEYTCPKLIAEPFVYAD